MTPTDLKTLGNFAAFQVGVGVRIVPAGLSADGQFVRASLILSPIAPGKADCGKTIDIRQWPQRVELMLQGADVAADSNSNIQVAFSPVKDGPDLAAPSRAAATLMPAVRAMFHVQPAKDRIAEHDKWIVSRRDPDVLAIGEMWTRLVGPTDEDWKCIIDALRQSGVARLEKLNPPPPAAPAAAAVGPAAGAAPGASAPAAGAPASNPNPPDIRGIGRGHAALLLSLERGRSLLSRLRLHLQNDPCIDSDACVVGSSIDVAPKSYLTVAQQQAAGPWTNVKRQQAEKVAKTAYDKMSPEDQHKQDLLLQQDLEAEGRKLRDKAAQDRQSAVNEKRANIAKTGGKRSARMLAYEQLLACSVTDSVSECMKNAAHLFEDKLSNAVDGSVDRHRDAVHEDDEVKPDPQPKRDLETAHDNSQMAKAPQTRLAGLQNQPSLARLFNLTVDILIPIKDFTDSASQADPFDERWEIPGKARFGFLSAMLVCRSGQRRVWTTCKIRLAGMPDNAPETDVWTCTRTELDLFATLSTQPGGIATRDALIAEGALSQIDGVVHIAAARKIQGVKDLKEPRFDIISLDAAQAVENRQTAKVSAKPGAQPLVTLRTAGLALVDRWRETSALVQALNSLDRADSATDPVIDAEDLTVGFRMDVAVTAKDGQLRWRSLCQRWIKFGDANNRVEPLLSRIIPHADDRLAYDSAIVVMPAKTQPSSAGNDVAHVDDTVGHWTGPPIGIDANSEDIVLGRTPHALQLGHCYSLGPDPDHPDQLDQDIKIPPQLFGGGYFFGLTPRLLGGVVRPFSKNKQQGWPYRPVTSGKKDLDPSATNFAVLPTPTVGPRRLLRHERIEQPIVATPERMLRRTFDGVVDGLRETADTIVVRTRPKPGNSKPGDPKIYLAIDKDDQGTLVTSSARIVIPPGVSAEFADRHDVFGGATTLTSYRDCGTRQWEGPVSGLQDVDYDHPAGGFPVYEFSESSRGGLEVKPSRLDKPTGDAVFRPRGGGGARREPYYPDPAAAYMVVALRTAAGQYMAGAPLVVPIRPAGVDYPNVRPIAVDVVAKSTRGDRPASHERILGLQASKAKGGYLRGTDVLKPGNKIEPDAFAMPGKDVAGAVKTVTVSRVQVELEPGESVEIGMWCLPKDYSQLARWFDAVESSTLIASVDRYTGQGCVDCESFGKRLRDANLPIDDLMRKLGLSRAAADGKICASGSTAVPRGALLCIAQTVYDMLQSRPVPELAAFTSISATHAIEQPFAAPAIALKLSRVASATLPADDVLPQQTVAIAGTVSVDRPTTGFFEVHAEGVSLVSNAFDDDQRRRRTPDEVARGVWPRSPVSDELMTVRDIYGFDVKPDGTVDLQYERASLLRIDDDIPPPDPLLPGHPPAPTMVLRDLAALQAQSDAATAGGNVVRIHAPFTISDGRARIVKLWAIAGSRSAACFRDEKGDIRSDAIASTKSVEQKLVVQATKAPAKVSPLTILPAFHLKPDNNLKGNPLKFSVEREVRLRIRMRRPWFSSGEGERLGIVLWPPEILSKRIIASEDGVLRDYDVVGNEKAEIAMANFRDEDLGAGGSFVTRWGLDPIKGGGELSWLTPPSAFVDLPTAQVYDGAGTNPDLPSGPLYVPRASVPIPVDDGSGNRRQTWLQASLLTYLPRFDIDHESWFCDVNILPGSAPEPFMRLGLVRYQPYAPEALRVSEPVVEWLQIPQQRTVNVKIDSNNSRLVKVEVTGTGSTSAESGPHGNETTRIESWTQHAVMKITVLRQRADGTEDVAVLDSASLPCIAGYSNRAERVWLPKTQAEWTDELTLRRNSSKPRQQCAVQPNHPAPNSTLSWNAEFLLKDDPLRPDRPGTVYSVLVEEVQPMLPATYANEPFDAETMVEQELTVSGPRFAARVELKVRDEKAKGGTTPPATPTKPKAKLRPKQKKPLQPPAPAT